MSNLKLWDSVDKTDPAITKAVNFGRRFTAICPQSQLKKATEVFGVFGEAWRLEDFKWTYIGDPDNPAEVVLQCNFVISETHWFPVVVGMRWKPGQDIHTKLMTHARSKALSMLGFNSDIYEGKFDDSRYVEHMKDLHSKQSEPEAEQPATTDRDTVLAEISKRCTELGLEPEKKKMLVAGWLADFNVKSFTELTAEQLRMCLEEVNELHV